MVQDVLGSIVTTQSHLVLDISFFNKHIYSLITDFLLAETCDEFIKSDPALCLLLLNTAETFPSL